MLRFTALITILVFALMMPVAVSATGIGVGVGTAEIKLNESLQPTKSYPLPVITVVNTGTVKTNYQFDITFLESQPEHKPAQEWFEISPRQFELEPNKTQAVSINLKVPIDAKSGEYFAFLEAGALKVVQQSSGNSVGVAAATKLRFSVDNPGYVEVVKTIVQENLSNNLIIYIAVAIVIIAVILLVSARKFLRVSVSVKPKKPKTTTDYF